MKKSDWKPAYMPTKEEILKATRKVQGGWDGSTEERRSGRVPSVVTLKEFSFNKDRRGIHLEVLNE